MKQPELNLEYFDLVECGEGLNHHLRRKPSGLWQMRVTMCRGRKYVGLRVTVGLATKCVREARIRRDIALKILEKAGSISPETQARIN